MTSLVTVDAEDPLVAFNFCVEIADQVTGFFMEISGIGSETAVVEQGQVGAGGQQVVRKVPGRLKWNDITLKRGVTSNMDFWVWSQSISNGSVDDSRFNGTITMFAQDGSPVAMWNFEKAWLKDVSVPQFKSDGSDIAITEATFAHEYIVRVQ
jgi:phage tail-like protein